LLEQAGQPRSDSVARSIVLGLPDQPVVSAATAAARHDVTPTAARSALNRLDETGVLQPTRVGQRRNREWINNDLFTLLDGFEHDLGEPPDDQTRRPSPSPTNRPTR
jgi:hypothetical protein